MAGSGRISGTAIADRVKDTAKDQTSQQKRTKIRKENAADCGATQTPEGNENGQGKVPKEQNSGVTRKKKNWQRSGRRKK